MRRPTGLALATLFLLSACASGRREPPPPPPPPSPSNYTPALQPLRPPPRAKAVQPMPSGPAGTSCRYCVGNDAGKRQYFDQKRKRYYFFDRVRKAYFWENGEPKI